MIFEKIKILFTITTKREQRNELNGDIAISFHCHPEN
jgi:hypothetical protein